MKISIKVLLQCLLFTWLLTAVIVFVYVSRVSYVYFSTFPTIPEFLVHLARISLLKYFFDIFYGFAGIALFFFACLSLGLRVLHGLRNIGVSRLGLCISAFLVGEIFYSVLFLTVIRLGSLTPLFVVTALSIGLLTGISLLKSNIVGSLSEFNGLKFDKWDTILMVLAIISFFAGLFLSSNRLGYDATAEYFSHSKIMAISRLPLFFYPSNGIVVSAFHPGILHAALIQLFGDQSARMLSWLNGLVLLVLGSLIGERLGLSIRARVYFIVLMMTSTFFVDLLGDGKIEIISTAPIIAAVYWMLKSLDNRSIRIYLLIGLFAGFAIISRPYNIFLVSMFVVLFYLIELIFQQRDGLDGIRQRFKVLWMLPSLLLLGAFHLWQNYMWLGSPFAPLEYAKETTNSTWAWHINPAMLNFLRFVYPFSVTYLNSYQSLGNISPLVIGFLPFLLVIAVRKKLTFSPSHLLVLVSSVLLLLFWITFFFTVFEIRYVLFLWILLFLTVSLLMDAAPHWLPRSITVMANVLIALLLAIMGIRTAVMSVISYAPIDNMRHANCFDFELCTFFVPINTEAEVGDRVFVLNAFRYYLRPDLFACSSRSDEYSRLEPMVKQASPNFWTELYRLGFRYIIFEEHLAVVRYQFGELPPMDTVPEWLLVEEVSDSGSPTEKILRLTAIDTPPVSQEKVCEFTDNGTWQVISASDAAVK